MRDIGDQFGVGEDAAQKRLQRALEKLTRFFQRHGFKTASMAATIATLKATSVTASAATATVVVNAALHATPPTLTGLAAAIARITALSKAQTAALCVLASAGPVVWQWNQAGLLKSERTAVQSKAFALQADQKTSDTELSRLRAELSRLEALPLGAPLDRAKEQEAARKLADLKTRLREMLAASNFRWPNDLPFTRIPKAALPSMSLAGGPNTPDKLKVKLGLLMDLSPSEMEATDRAFANYFGSIDQLFATGLYETSHATSLKLPSGAQSRIIVLQAMGPSIRSAMDQLCANLTGVLGEDRRALIKPDSFEMTQYEQNRLLGYTQYAWDKTWEIGVNIFPNTGGEPLVSLTDNMGMNTSLMPLRAFLQKKSTSTNGPRPWTACPDRQRQTVPRRRGCRSAIQTLIQ